MNLILLSNLLRFLNLVFFLAMSLERIFFPKDRSYEPMIEHISSILGHINADMEEGILKEMSKEMPKVAQKIKNKIIKFDDIENYQDDDLRTLIQTTPHTTIAKALSHATPFVKEKFFNNMPEHMAYLMQQEIETEMIAMQESQKAQTDVAYALKNTIDNKRTSRPKENQIQKPEKVA